MAVTQTMPALVWQAIPDFPIYVDSRTVGASTAESFTVPAGTTSMLLSGTMGFYASITGTAVAATDVSDGTGSIYIPSSGLFRIGSTVASATTLSILATAAGQFTVAWYKS